LLAAYSSHAQEGDLKRQQLAYFVYTDIVYDAESIPNIGYEHFFTHKGALQSWRVSAGYQVHYSDSFGIVTSHGDRVSIGVYQGPAAKFAWNLYSPKRRRNWDNYCSFGLGLKYLWYDKVPVLTGTKKNDQSYRIQSERCWDAVPQFAIGTKRIRGWFCADFYIGVQVPVKDRLKTVYYDQTVAAVNPNVPYTSKQLMIEPGLLVGIKIGVIKTRTAKKKQ